MVFGLGCFGVEVEEPKCSTYAAGPAIFGSQRQLLMLLRVAPNSLAS